VAFNPFFFCSALSAGIRDALKAPGSDWNRDLNMPKVRICEQEMTINDAKHGKRS